MLQIIERKAALAIENMDFDENFLEELKRPSLHFYKWKKKAVTYGYFINIEEFIDINKAKEEKMDIAKRPTGGGIIFHIWDFAFSFFMPQDHKFFFENPLKNYFFVHGIILSALKNSFHMEEKDFSFENNKDFYKKPQFCMGKSSKYDLLFKNKKIAGGAQRKKKRGYLHQGSISLVKPDKELLETIILKKEFLDQILKNGYFLLEKKNRLLEENLKSNLINCFKKRLF